MGKIEKYVSKLNHFQDDFASVSFIDESGNESKFISHIPKPDQSNISKMQNDIIDLMMLSIDNDLFEFFNPYLRATGIKGEITKGKIKWRGIKMISHLGFDFTNYQLFQRGKKISPVYRVNYRIENFVFTPNKIEESWEK
jgi:hypothetical protein